MKKIVLIIVLLSGFVLLNDRAALYDKQITPSIRSYLPFDWTVHYQDAAYHLLDKEKYFIIHSDDLFPTEGRLTSGKDKIFVTNINGIYWTDNRVIVDVLSEKGRELIEIKETMTNHYVRAYDFVTSKSLLEMSDRVDLNSPPTIIKYWRLVGSFYLLILFGGIVFFCKRKQSS